MFYKIKGVSKRSGKGSVSVIYRQHDFEILRSTGVTVAPSEFDTKTGKVKSRVEEYPELNAKIQEVVGALEKAIRDVKATHGVITRAALEAALNQEPLPQPVKMTVAPAKVKQAKQPRQQTLCQRFSEYISRNPEHRGIKTLLGYTDVLNKLQGFDSTIKLSEVNLKFFQGFQSYLVREGMRNGSVRTNMDRFKKLYTTLADEEDVAYSFLKRFKAIADLADENVIFLIEEEIAALEALPLRSLRQRQVRAQFIFSCEVGLRHSDLYITRANIKGDTLQLVMRKGKRTVKPPLTEKAKAILASEYFPFHTIFINQYNNTISAICKKIPSFWEKVVFTHFIGNNPVTEEKMKWEAISSHVGRKTAINNWLNKGIRESVVAKWVGHKNTKMIEKHYQNYEAASEMEALKLLDK